MEWEEGVSFVIGQPKNKPFEVLAFLVLFVAGLVCLVAATLLETPNHTRGWFLERGLRIAAVVIQGAGVFFLVRWKIKERKARE